MLMSILQIVGLPIAIGLVVNGLARSLVRRAEPVLPLVSMVSILAIIAAVVGDTHASIATVGPLVARWVVLHNGIGRLAGYWAGKSARGSTRDVQGAANAAAERV